MAGDTAGSGFSLIINKLHKGVGISAADFC